MTLTIAIQAGGRSSRMGCDKGLVKIAGIPMIEHVLNRVQGGCSNRYNYPGDWW